MHMTIRAIVPGEDQEEALSNAKQIFEDLVERGYFDYYSTFDEKNAKSRHETLPVAVKVNSPEGKKLIDEGMQYTKKDFFENLNKVRSILAVATNEELAKGKDNKVDPLFRYYCYCIGQYAGPYVWLYNRYGEGIRDQAELKWALEKETEGEKLWVVPADVHY